MPPGARLTRFARAAAPSAVGGGRGRAAADRRSAARASRRVGPRSRLLAVAAANSSPPASTASPPASRPASSSPTSQELRGRSEPYRVALAGLPRLRELSLRLNSRTPVSLGGEPALLKASDGLGPVSHATSSTSSRPAT
jgi:hypothetical protein